MVIYKNKFFVKSEKYPDTDFAGNADWVIPDDSELADKIIALYPYFDFVLDDNGNISDVVEVEPAPSPPVISLEQRISAMEDATAEIIEMLMGGE